MPVKKPSTVAKKDTHKHADLEKEILLLRKELAAVKKEAESLKGQCHSCCGDIAALKSELADLKSVTESGAKDSRIDMILKILNMTDSKSYSSFRAMARDI